jgi:hypothetical protein
VDRLNGGSEDPRQGFDGFDELLTTCVAVNRVLVVEAMALQRAQLMENTHVAIVTYQTASRRQDEGEPMAMCMHAMNVGAWRNVCFLPLRGSTPKSER